MAIKFRRLKTQAKKFLTWLKDHFERWFASLKKNTWVPVHRELKASTKKSIAWVKTHFEVWFTILIGVAFVTLLILGPILQIITIYPGDAPCTQNRLYLLSAAAQSLAAILASQTFTPHVMRLKLKDIYFWLFIIIYLITILWTLGVMGWLRWLGWFPKHDRWVMDVCLLLVGSSLVFLIPYVYETINSLKPKVFVDRLLKKHDTRAVEETLHRAVSEGFITLVGEVAELVDLYTVKEMVRAPEEKRSEIARRTTDCYRNVAKRARKKKEHDSFDTIFKHLTRLTRLSTELKFRAEADVFNDAVTELYDFAQEEE